VYDKILELRGQPDKIEVFLDKWDGIGDHEHVVRMGIRKQENDRIPNVKVEFGSYPLAVLGGLGEAWKWLTRCIGDFGGKITRHVLSRVDMYTDVVGWTITEFQRRFFDGWRISRARMGMGYGFEDIGAPSNLAWLGRRNSGFRLGCDPMIRVYDKKLELRRSPDKAEVFDEKWGFPSKDDPVIRTEFQLRREAIKRFLGGGRVDTVEDYVREKAGMWAYLTEDFFRMTEGPVDAENGNQEKAKTWSVWEKVQKAAGDDVIPARRVERVSKVDIYAWISQGIAVLMKGGVEWNCHVDGYMSWLRMVAQLGKVWCDGDDDKFAALWDRFRMERDQRVLQVPKASDEEGLG